VKPTRGMVSNRIGSLARERRTGLIALGIMLVMLSALLVYQRLTTEPQASQEGPFAEQPIESGELVRGTIPPPESVSVPVMEPLTQLTYPLNNAWQVIKHYGSIDQAFGDFRIFNGLAIAAAPSASVMAGGPGTVIEVEQDPLDGGAVVIDHGSGLLTRYAGLGNIVVQLKQEVKTGQALGHIATINTGARHSLGSHLYLQVFKDGHSINPATYLPN